MPSTSPGRRAPFATPAVADGVVDRPRVAAEIAERLSRHGLVQVHGAPGTGKTTAVAQAVALTPGPAAWLTLSEWHQEPGRLLDDLVDALEAVAPGRRTSGRRPRSGQSEILRAAAELASAAGRAGGGVLVLDDCHLLARTPDSAAVLGAFVRSRDERLRMVLVGREAIPLPGVGVEAHRPDAYVGSDLLNADLEEATSILRASGSSAEADEALHATGGWVAGLVFEAWRGPDVAAAGLDPLEIYFSAEFRPRAGAAYEALVDCSVFDRVDARRLTSLGYENAPAILRRLRAIGVPATWSDGGTSMRLHPRVRELLGEELGRTGSDRVGRVRIAAARVFEREGELERAVDLYAAAGAVDEADRLLDDVIVDIVERGDLTLAERLLDQVHPALDADTGPAPILALLMIRSARQASGVVLQRLADHLSHDDDRLRALILAEPRISPFACVAFSGLMRYDEAGRLPELTPPGRSADTTRLILACTVNDDPDAPLPPLLGDALDPLIARALWFKGRLLELRAGMDDRLALAAGVPGLVVAADPESPLESGGLGARLTQFLDAVERRDLGVAEQLTEAIAARPSPVWAGLCEAELAVRIARDPVRATRAVARLRELRVTEIQVFRELTQVWEGGALLLAGEDAAAADLLRHTARSMRRGDRTAELVTALVYLAEAEWRVGNEDAADEAGEAARLVASEQGSLRRLLLALVDFPGVASRRIDAEAAPDGAWHALGRALAGRAAPGAARSTGGGTVRLRELGEPAIVHRGAEIKTKIRKSIELLAYLLSRPSARATRAEVLTALWNGRDDDSTRAYLRQALRHLRDALPDGITVESADDVLAIAGVISSESGELEALVSEAALQTGDRRRGILLEIRALLTRGAFLTGSEGVVWIDDRRERLRSMLADVRLDLADLSVQSERYVEALSLVDEALADDPLLERGWRLRIRALSMLGDSDGVLSAYRACHEALGEIGLEPSRATTELVRTLRS